jgi:hypothetical protein
MWGGLGATSLSHKGFIIIICTSLEEIQVDKRFIGMIDNVTGNVTGIVTNSI